MRWLESGNRGQKTYFVFAHVAQNLKRALGYASIEPRLLPHAWMSKLAAKARNDDTTDHAKLLEHEACILRLAEILGTWRKVWHVLQNATPY